MRKFAFISSKDLFPQNRAPFIRVLPELYDVVDSNHVYVITRKDLKDYYEDLQDNNELHPLIEGTLRTCDNFLYKHDADGIIFDCDITSHDILEIIEQ
jgi:hypothetical protein